MAKHLPSTIVTHLFIVNKSATLLRANNYVEDERKLRLEIQRNAVNKVYLVGLSVVIVAVLKLWEITHVLWREGHVVTYLPERRMYNRWWNFRFLDEEL